MGWFNRLRLRGRLEEQRLELQQKMLTEALSLTTTFVDPTDALRDPETGRLWDALGTSRDGGVEMVISSEEQLRAARSTSRNLGISNEFAINGFENRISYVVGTGHAYTVVAKDGQELSDEMIAPVQEVIDEFLDENHWHRRQQEIALRKDRDGECFLRFFPSVDGIIRVRFIEPIDVATPNDRPAENEKWGIITDPKDVETVWGYFIKGEGIVDPSEIQHRKQGVDSNVKRGMPLFYPVFRNLDRAEKLLQCMTSVANIQAAIAIVRKHSAGTGSTITNWAEEQADLTHTNQTTGDTHHYRGFAPGSILDVSAGVEYDYPAGGIDASKFVMVLQAELRAIASRLCMPEFMLTSDASNANYSSTMVAEGPAVKMFQRLQWSIIEDDREVFDRVMDAAVESGRISEDIRQRIEIDIEPPRLESRDRNAEVEADVKLVTNKIMSKHTAMLRQDLDPEAEEAQIDEEREKADPYDGMGFGIMRQGNEQGNEQGDEEGNEDSQ